MRTLAQVLSLSRRPPRPKAAVIIGADAVGDSAKRFSQSVSKRYNVIDVVSGDDESAAKKRLASADVVLVDSHVRADEKRRIVQLCVLEGKEILLVPDLYDIMLHHAEVSCVDDIPLLRIGASLSPFQRAIKRLLDVLLASLALILSMPAFLVTAVLIKVTSKGPVFYRQERVGLNGLPFTLSKFRTMVEDAEAATGPVLATDNDRRITAIGKVLRTSRMDELPQLLNILRGEMSLVGPRPERPFFVNRFSASIPAYRHRFRVKPGLTGLAQVLGKYSTRPEDKLRYDLIYIQRCSLPLDLWIMLMTFRVLLSPGAARGVLTEMPSDCE